MSASLDVFKKDSWHGYAESLKVDMCSGVWFTGHSSIGRKGYGDICLDIRTAVGNSKSPEKSTNVPRLARPSRGNKVPMDKGPNT